jgi:RNA polymerase sigma factor (sigma-70 family)
VLDTKPKAADDQRLIAAFRAGDDAAFSKIFDRHHARLLRYARKVLGKSSEHAEDVVQEGMLRASRALRRDERHIELRPWLYRLVRNCALDEIARVRTDSVALDDADEWGVLRAPKATEPHAATERRGKLRNLVDDIAGLPAPQRHALVRREVDGISHAALAGELGMSQQASKSLVHRARTNLIKQEEARSTDCHDVRRVLLEAHDEGRRASAAAYRHLASCRECRTFRSGLRDTRRAAAMLIPAPLLLVAFGLLTGKAAAATGKGALAKTGATVAASAAVTAGAVGVGVQVFDHGDPAPQSARSIALPDGRLAKGSPVPKGTAIVQTKTVRFAAGEPVKVTLPCPAGQRVADLLAVRGATASYLPGTVVGSSRAAQVVVEPQPGTSNTRVSVLCKAPDASGSIVAGSQKARASGGALMHVQVTRTELLERPGGAAVGSVRRDQPVHAIGGVRDGWRRVKTDTGATGWLPADAVR